MRFFKALSTLTGSGRLGFAEPSRKAEIYERASGRCDPRQRKSRAEQALRPG